MKMIEITREDVIEITSTNVFQNREKYYQSGQEFFLKIKHIKDLVDAYLERYKYETEDHYRYCFRCYFEDGKDFININDKIIQHIYIEK